MRIPFLFAGVLGALASLSLCSVGQGNLMIQASVGGTPSGGTFANFDNLPLGDTGGSSGGLTIAFTGDAQAVQGSVNDEYTAPYLSNSQGLSFGDPNNGPDTTTYLTSGLGSVSLSLPGQEHYVGLLWGAVESNNTLTLYNNSTLVATVTGSDITVNADGDQGVDGTFYVNLSSSVSFNEVVASSSTDSFNFDNVAYGDLASTTPEPSSGMIVIISSFLFLGGAWRRPLRRAT